MTAARKMDLNVCKSEVSFYPTSTKEDLVSDFLDGVCECVTVTEYGQRYTAVHGLH